MTTNTTNTRLRSAAKLIGLGLLSAGLIGVAAGVAEAATAHTGTTAHTTAAAASHPTTLIKTIRPVTATGHVAKGWKVVDTKRSISNCADHSTLSDESGIAYCGGSSDNAGACWKSAVKGRVLCASPDDLVKHRLRSYKYAGAGAFGTKADDLPIQPVVLHLQNGMTMYARNGGAWSRVKQHPSWVGWFYQAGSFTHTIYGPSDSVWTGLNEKTKAWYGVVYGDVNKPGFNAYVRIAYFVGNAH